MTVFMALGSDAAEIDPAGTWEGSLVYKLKISRLGKVKTETSDYVWFNDTHAQPGGDLPLWSVRHGTGEWHYRGQYARAMTLVWQTIDEEEFGRSVAGIARANGRPDMGEPGVEMRVELKRGKGRGRIKKGDIMVLRSNVRFLVTSALHPGKTWKGRMKMKHSMNQTR
jgi:hypothetical protein